MPLEWKSALHWRNNVLKKRSLTVGMAREYRFLLKHTKTEYDENIVETSQIGG